MGRELAFEVGADGELRLGKAARACFGCGSFADRREVVTFEETDRVSLGGKFTALASRTRFSLPLCAKCVARRGALLWVALGWLAVTMALALAGMAAITRFVKDDDAQPIWFMGVLVVAAFPMSWFKDAWTRKDRGGCGVELAGERDGRLVLEFASEAAAARVERELQA